MASSLLNFSDYDPNDIPSSKGMTFGIAVSDWNQEITYSLLKACVETLEQQGTSPELIKIIHVPGTFELPKACAWLADHHWWTENDEMHMIDAVIALGCVITGETKHDEYINSAVSQGLMQLNLSSKIPFIFGVLTPRTLEQAQDRAGGKYGNKGVEAAIAAIKMAKIHQELDIIEEESSSRFLNDLTDEEGREWNNDDDN